MNKLEVWSKRAAWRAPGFNLGDRSISSIVIVLLHILVQSQVIVVASVVVLFVAFYFFPMWLLLPSCLRLFTLGFAEWLWLDQVCVPQSTRTVADFLDQIRKPVHKFFTFHWSLLEKKMIASYPNQLTGYQWVKDGLFNGFLDILTDRLTDRQIHLPKTPLTTWCVSSFRFLNHHSQMYGGSACYEIISSIIEVSEEN